MSKLGRVDSSRLLARLLEEPDLAPIVQSLDAPVLGRLVRHVGLEDAGEVMALATHAQLASLFDDDLWTSPSPGVEETFDPTRFALWLEVLLAADEASTIEKVAAMDEDFLAFALAENVFVIDMDALADDVEDLDDEDRDALEKSLDAMPSEELDEIRVVARDLRSWDPILTVIVGLDRDHHALLRRVLDQVAAATARLVDDAGGLSEVLDAAETLAADAAGAREDRREAEGYLSASQAAAFLRLALVTPRATLLDETSPDPVERAYRRAQPKARAPRPTSTAARAFLRDLADAGVLEDADVIGRLVGAPPSSPSASRKASSGAVRAALAALRTGTPDVFARNVDQLAFLVNVVVAAVGGNPPIHPAQATEAALAMCDHGAASLARHLDMEPVEVVATRGLVAMFRMGFHDRGEDPWTRETFFGR